MKKTMKSSIRFWIYLPIVILGAIAVISNVASERNIRKVNDKATVISDRYLFSSLAYQSISCGEELPKLLNSTFPLPEILFFFEIAPEISLKRVDSRNEKKEIYEKIETQKKIALEYEKIISGYDNNTSCGMKIIRIDATKSIEEISDTISKIILQ